MPFSWKSLYRNRLHNRFRQRTSPIDESQSTPILPASTISDVDSEDMSSPNSGYNQPLEESLSDVGASPYNSNNKNATKYRSNGKIKTQQRKRRRKRKPGELRNYKSPYSLRSLWGSRKAPSVTELMSTSKKSSSVRMRWRSKVKYNFKKSRSLPRDQTSGYTSTTTTTNGYRRQKKTATAMNGMTTTKSATTSIVSGGSSDSEDRVDYSAPPTVTTRPRASSDTKTNRRQVMTERQRMMRRNRYFRVKSMPKKSQYSPEMPGFDRSRRLTAPSFSESMNGNNNYDHTTKVKKKKSTSTRIKLGSRVEILAGRHGGHIGTVKFIGSVDFAKGKWCGISLDKPMGVHNGTVQRRKYFECEKKHGVFLKAGVLEPYDGDETAEEYRDVLLSSARFDTKQFKKALELSSASSMSDRSSSSDYSGRIQRALPVSATKIKPIPPPLSPVSASTNSSAPSSGRKLRPSPRQAAQERRHSGTSDSGDDMKNSNNDVENKTKVRNDIRRQIIFAQKKKDQLRERMPYLKKKSPSSPKDVPGVKAAKLRVLRAQSRNRSNRSHKRRSKKVFKSNASKIAPIELSIPEAVVDPFNVPRHIIEPYADTPGGPKDDHDSSSREQSISMGDMPLPVTLPSLNENDEEEKDDDDYDDDYDDRYKYSSRRQSNPIISPVEKRKQNEKRRSKIGNRRPSI